MFPFKNKINDELLNRVSSEYLMKVIKSNDGFRDALCMSAGSHVFSIKKIYRDEYQIVIWDNCRLAFFMIIGRIIDDEFICMLEGFIPDFIYNKPKGT